MRQLPIARFVFAVVITLAVSATIVWAFAEEPLGFRDPASGEVTGGVISTIHDDLSYVLALAAGFSITDSKILQVWNQLVDSEQLTGTATTYSNCLGSFPAAPSADAVCGSKPHSNVVWPQWDDMANTQTCATSRFGPYSPFFHFPHGSGPLAARDIGALHDWGWGITDTLTGYEAYAWGRPTEVTVFQASCRYTRTSTIDTGIAAGSLQAFATYLHSLGDSYSHEECNAAMDALGMEWPTHTTVTVTACLYHPNNMQADDVHGREFFTYTDSLRTDMAVRHVYAEMVSRSLRYEGQYPPLELGVRLAAISGTPTLSEALSTFVHAYDYNGAANRRAYGDALAVAVLWQRPLVRRTYLPMLLR
jgi:hypothetical protein